MSRQIDEKVVKVTLENSNFEKNATQTIQTSEKLEESLKFKSAQEGLEGVSKKAKDVDLKPMEKDVNKVEVAFSKLEVAAITALTRITNAAIDTGVSLVKSLTVDNYSAGWAKYESKASSVQGIMNATGKSIEEVNAYLDKLMRFSDETSYSFSEMTEAFNNVITTGADADKALDFVTGIANASAFAGKTGDAFNRTIRNLTQAYGTGFLGLADWKSIELAQTNSKQLVESFIQAGVELGKINEGAVTLGTFRDSLSDRWLDTEVMEKVFGDLSSLYNEAYDLVEEGVYKDFASAYEALGANFDDFVTKATLAGQEAKTFAEAIEATKDAVSSGWMTSFELIFGDYEEAKKLWTDVTGILWDLFAAGAEGRNEMLSEWKDMEIGGRTSAIDAFYYSLAAVLSVFNPIKHAWTATFGSMNAERLASIVSTVENFTKNLILSEDSMYNLKTTFQGLFSILGIGTDAIGRLWEAFKQFTGLFPSASTGVDALLATTAKIGEFFIGLRDIIDKGSLSDVFTYLSTYFKKATDAIDSFVYNAIDSLRNFSVTFNGKQYQPFMVLANFLEKMFDSLSTLLNRFGFNPLDALRQLIEDGMDGIKSLVEDILSGKFPNPFTALLSIFSSGFEALDTFFGNLPKIRWEDVLGIAGMVTAIFALVKIFNVSTKLFGSIGEFMEAASEIMESTRKAIDRISKAGSKLIKSIAFSIKIKAISELIFSFAKSIALLAGVAIILGQIPADQLFKGIASLGGIMLAMAGLTFIMSKIDPKASATTIGVLLSMGAAAIMLSKALGEIGTLSEDQFIQGMVGVAAVLAAVVVAMNKLKTKTKGRKQNIMEGTTQSLIAIATGLLILGKAIKSFGKMDPDVFIQGLIGVGASLAMLVIAIRAIPTNQLGVSAGLIMSFGAGLFLLGTAVKMFGKMDLDTLVKGGVMVGVMLKVLVSTVNKVVNRDKDTKTAAATILALAASMSLLAVAVAMFGKMKLSTLIQGGLAVAAMLVTLAFSANLAAKGVDKSAVATIAALTVALLGLYGATLLFGTMDLKTLVQGGLSVVAMLIALGGAAKLASKTVKARTAVNIIALAASIVILSLAMHAFVSALDPDISAEQMLVSVSVFAAMVGLAIAIGQFNKVIPDIKTTTTAVGKIGVLMVEVAAVMAIIGALNNIFGGAALIDSAGELFASIGAAIGNLIGGFIGGIAEGIISRLPSIGSYLSEFATNIEGFLTMAGGLKPSDLEGVLVLANIINTLRPGLFDGIFELFAGDIYWESLANDLEALGDGVSRFAEKIDGLDSSSVTKAANATKILAQAAQAIPTSGGLWQDLFGEHDMEAFGKNLGGLGLGVAEFAKNTEGVTPETLEPAADAAKVLAEMLRAIPRSGGVIESVIGWQDMDQFRMNIGKMALAVGAFSRTIKAEGVDVEATKAGAEAAAAMIDALNKVDLSGGAIDWWIGTQDTSKLVTNVTNMADALVAFNSTMVNNPMDAETVKTGAEALSYLMDAMNSLSEVNGVFAVLLEEAQQETGINVYDAFAKAIANIALSMGSISRVMKTEQVDPDAIKDAATGMKSLVEAYNGISASLPETFAIMGLFTDNENESVDFVTVMTSLAEGLSEYARYATLFTNDKVLSSFNILERLGEASQAFFVDAGLYNIGAKSGEMMLDAAEVLPDIGSYLADFASNMGNIDLAGMNAGVRMLKDLSDIENALDRKEFFSISSFAKSLSEMAEEGITAFSQAFKDYEDDVGKDVESLLKAATAAVNAYTGLTEATGMQVTAVKAKYGDFKTAGNYLVAGLIKGIDDKKTEANNAMVAMAQSMIQSFENEAQIASPSVIMKEDGSWLVQGATEGIESNTSAEEAMEKKAQNIISAFEKVLNEADLKTTTANLEYELWKVLYGDTASAATLNAAALENLRDQVAAKQDEVNVNAATMVAMRQEFGEGSKEATEAYNKWLQSQIDLQKLQQEITKTQTENVKSQKDAYREAWQSYYDLLANTNFDALYQAGFTRDQIESYLRNRSGLEQLDKETQESFKGITEGIQTVLDDTLTKTTVFLEKTTVQAATQATSQAAYAGAYSVGQNFDEGAADGIEDYTNLVEDAVKEYADKGLEALRGIIGWDTHSPSKKTYELGIFFDEGAANGIKDGKWMVLDAVTDVATESLQRFSSILSNIDFSKASVPSINPIVDMNQINSQLSGMQPYYSLKTAIRANAKKATNVDKVTTTAKANANVTEVYETNTYNTNFNQTNNSPKAISTTEVYRQTKNLFNTVKDKAGVVSAPISSRNKS